MDLVQFTSITAQLGLLVRIGTVVTPLQYMMS